MATVLSATGAISLSGTPLSASAGAALPGYTTRTATATLLSGTYYITTTSTYLTQTTPTPTTPVSVTQTGLGAATSTRRITSGSITRTGTSLASTTSRASGVAASAPRGGAGGRLPAGAITAIAIVSTLVVFCLFSAWAYWYRRRNIRRRIAGQRVEVDGEEAVTSPISGGDGGPGWTTPWNRARSPPPPSYTQVRTELDTEKLAGTFAGTFAAAAAGMAGASENAGRTGSTGGAGPVVAGGSERAPVSGYILEDDPSPISTSTSTPIPEPASASASASELELGPVYASGANTANPRRGDNDPGPSGVVQDGPARGIRESLATGRIELADETSEMVLFPPTYGSLYPRG